MTQSVNYDEIFVSYFSFIFSIRKKYCFLFKMRHKYADEFCRFGYEILSEVLMK